MLPETQTHSLRTELCLILAVMQKEKSFPSPHVLRMHRSPPALSWSGRSLPQQRPVALDWPREESVVRLWQGLRGWHSFEFCRRKNNCVWVWVLVFNGIAIFLEIFISLMLFWRSSVSLLGWVFKKIGACPVWIRESALANLARMGAVGSHMLIGTCLYNCLI